MEKSMNDAELGVLSTLTGIDKNILANMYEYKLLDVPGCKKLLIKEEFRIHVENNSGRKGDITNMLAKKYEISKSLVEHIIYDKNTQKPVRCIMCGVQITKYKHRKNKGYCDVCNSL